MARVPFVVGDQSLNFVVSDYGMGNRIVPLGCALSLAKELNYRLVTVWPKSPKTGCVRFDDLFDTTNLPFEVVGGFEARFIRGLVVKRSSVRRNVSRKIFDILLESFGIQYEALFTRAVVKNSLAERKFSRKLFGIPLKFLGFQYEKDLDHHSLWRNPATDLQAYRKILLSTPRFFGRSCDVSWLKPAPHIVPRIAELKKKFTPNTIGVHVRGTDVGHCPAVEKIVSRMHAEVELDPEVKFFLASDGDESEKIILDTFGDRLIRTTPSIVSERRTVRGQQDAVVDLFGMASTSRLIGTWPSTFLVLASMIGNKPLIRVHPKDFVYMWVGMI